MIFRAIFWIGLVSLLTPHEPDLGLGRPGAGISLPPAMKSWRRYWSLAARTGLWCRHVPAASACWSSINTDASLTAGLADVRPRSRRISGQRERAQSDLSHTVRASPATARREAPGRRSCLDRRELDFGLLGRAGAAVGPNSRGRDLARRSGPKKSGAAIKARGDWLAAAAAWS